MSNKLGIFLAGGAVGAVAALLCAPRTGQEARTMVAEKVNEAWGQAQNISADAGVNAQQVYQSAAARGQEVVSSVQAKGQEVAGQAAARVQEVASNLKPSFTRQRQSCATRSRRRVSASLPRWLRTPRKPVRQPRRSSRPWPRPSSPLRKRSPRRLIRPRSRRPNSILFQS